MLARVAEVLQANVFLCPAGLFNAFHIHHVFQQAAVVLALQQLPFVAQAQQMTGQTGIDKMNFRHTHRHPLRPIFQPGREPLNDKHQLENFYVVFHQFVIQFQIIGKIGVFQQVAA